MAMSGVAGGLVLMAGAIAAMARRVKRTSA
jgi:hypothetical protein